MVSRRCAIKRSHSQAYAKHSRTHIKNPHTSQTGRRGSGYASRETYRTMKNAHDQSRGKKIAPGKTRVLPISIIIRRRFYGARDTFLSNMLAHHCIRRVATHRRCTGTKRNRVSAHLSRIATHHMSHRKNHADTLAH